MEFEYDPKKSRINRTKHKRTSHKPETAKEFDAYFEDHDISHLLEVHPKRINVDLPPVMLSRLDAKATQLGMTRQALIKYWLAERLHMTG